MTTDTLIDSGTVPAGTYFLGDPCYAVPDAHWQPLLDASGHFDGAVSGDVAGHTVYAFRIFDGDGPYTDQHGAEYPVDAGLIGLTPIAFANPENDPAKTTWLESSGRIVTFTEDVEISEEDGLLDFGPYRIVTREDDEEPTCFGCGGELVLGLCDDCDHAVDDDEDDDEYEDL